MEEIKIFFLNIIFGIIGYLISVGILMIRNNEFVLKNIFNKHFLISIILLILFDLVVIFDNQILTDFYDLLGMSIDTEKKGMFFILGFLIHQIKS